ncbi:MAG: lipopolysaccharide biosynthesis protein [Acidobacteriota bacterium]
MNQTRNLAKQAIMLITARSIAFLVTLSIPLILVRYLTQTEFGAYKQSILLYTTAVSLLPWGMSQSLYYFIPKQPEYRSGYLANTFLFLLIVGLMVLLGFVLGGPLLQRYFNNSVLAENSPILGLYIFFMITSIYGEITLVSENRVREAAWLILLNEVTKAVALIGSALLLHSFQGIVMGLATAAAVRFLLTSLYFRRDLKRVLQGPNLQLLRNQWHYAMPFGLMLLLGFFQDYFHQYYISYSFSPADFAIYAVGCLELPLIDLFYSSIGDIAMVKMTEHLRDGDKTAVRATWHEAIVKLAVIFYPLAFYLAVVNDQFIVALFTTRYQASAAIFFVSLLALPLAVLLTDPVMRVYGDMRFTLMISALRLPLTIPMVMGTLAMFGMIGGMVSTVFMLLLMRITMLARISILMQTGIKSLLPWQELGKIILTAAIAALVTLMIVELPVSPKLMLIITAPIYATTFLLIGIWLNIFPVEERQMVKRFIAKLPVISLLFNRYATDSGNSSLS